MKKEELFFVSCAMGFESAIKSEIENFWHLLIDLDGLPTRSRPLWSEVEIKGGVEINCAWHLGVQINFFSKLANRVLWRVLSFSARYFDQFEKEISKIKIHDYFGKEKFNIEVSSSKSRLFHEGNLKECFRKIFPQAKISNLNDQENLIVLDNSTEKSKDDHEYQYNLFIRLFNDKATVSVDTTGYHLHFRGYRKNQGEAPIRETLAYSMFEQLVLAVGFEKINETENVILDPFCGAGTLLFESAFYGMPLFLKVAAFENFNMRPAFFKTDIWKKNYKIQSQIEYSFLGIEKNKETFEKLNMNLNWCKENIKLDVLNRFETILTDSQDYLSQLNSNKKYFLIANPPYGERLNDKNAFDILEKYLDQHSVFGAVIVHPIQWQFKNKYEHLTRVQQTPFNNQGLKLNLSIWKN